MRRTTTWSWAQLAGLLACGPVVPGSDDTGSVSTAGAGSTTAAGTTTGTTADVTTTSIMMDDEASAVSETGAAAASSDSGLGFLVEFDAGGIQECDPFMQDCPPGEKCTPYVGDHDGSSYSSTKCVQVMANPAPPGQPCLVVAGQVCNPWFAEDTAPPGLENVGLCGVPT